MWSSSCVEVRNFRIPFSFSSFLEKICSRGPSPPQSVQVYKLSTLARYERLLRGCCIATGRVGNFCVIDGGYP